jgi:RNA polymerase sigma factor (sigma-70 family)
MLTHLLHALAVADLDPCGDAALVERFLADRDEAAFGVLVRRHGPVVMAVCRKVAGHEQDAEDAFQATFLVLARQAGKVHPRGQVGNWLFGVAWRTARKARGRAARIRTRETAGEIDRLPAPATDRAGDAEIVLREVERLPDLYRVPLVSCDLEDRPRKDVAADLGIPEGTLSSRLTAARAKLAARLARRGVAVPIASVGTALSATVAADGAVSGPLAATTVERSLAFAGADAAATSGPAADLAGRVLGTAALSRWIVIGAVATSALGIGAVVVWRSDGQPKSTARPEPPPVVADAPKPAPRVPPPLHRAVESAEWLLTAIDGKTRTLTLSEPVSDRADVRSVVVDVRGAIPGGFSLIDVPVAADAEVMLNGTKTTLDRLHVGLRARVTFRPGAMVVARIEAVLPKSPTFLYTLAAVDRDRRTVGVRLNNTADVLVDLPLAADAEVELLESMPATDGAVLQFRSGRLEDLTVGRTVGLDLRVAADGGLVVSRIRAGR